MITSLLKLLKSRKIRSKTPQFWKKNPNQNDKGIQHRFSQKENLSQVKDNLTTLKVKNKIYKRYFQFFEKRISCNHLENRTRSSDRSLLKEIDNISVLPVPKKLKTPVYSENIYFSRKSYLFELEGVERIKFLSDAGYQNQICHCLLSRQCYYR